MRAVGTVIRIRIRAVGGGTCAADDEQQADHDGQADRARRHRQASGSVNA
jgi:hypothetical protein